MTPITCGRCGRILRSARSIKRGYGPTCGAKRVQPFEIVDVVADYTAAQVEKARELVELGGIVRIWPDRKVFKVVSTKGDEVYRTHPAACNCPAGLHSRRCYHELAAQVLLIAG